MRICNIAEAGSIHTQRWLNYFARKGHEVHLICWNPITPGYDKSIHIHWLTKFAPQIWPVSRYISALLWIFQARQLVNKIHPDIVHGHFVTVHGFLAACSGFHPLVVSVWGSDILIDPRDNFLFKASAKYTLKRADVIIYNSQIVRAELGKLGVSSEKLSFVLNGVNTQHFSPQQRDEKLRSTLGLSRVAAVISVRILKPIYNVEMLIKAIPLVLKQAPQTKFIIAGDGEQKEYLKNLATSLDVSDNVHFVGWLPYDELPRYLASADIYVSTSLSDSAPVSLHEAMACELAPVVTDLPANRAWITDGENGFLVPVNDIQTLADRIVYLMRNESVRTSFGRVNRQITQDRTEYETEMAKVESIYRELAQAAKCKSGSYQRR